MSKIDPELKKKLLRSRLLLRDKEDIMDSF